MECAVDAASAAQSAAARHSGEPDTHACVRHIERVLQQRQAPGRSGGGDGDGDDDDDVPLSTLRRVFLAYRDGHSAALPALRQLLQQHNDTVNSYFEFSDAPLFADLQSPGLGNRGYALFQWLYLDATHSASPPSSPSSQAHVIIRLNTLDGVGVEVGYRLPTHAGALAEIVVRVTPDASTWKTLLTSSSKLVPLRKWFSLTLVHVIGHGRGLPRMHLYIDGVFAVSVDLAYPSFAKESLRVTLGGFCGRANAVSVFGDALSPRQVLSLHRQPPDRCPHFHAQFNGVVVGLLAPPAVPDTSFPLLSKSKLIFLPNVLLHLHARNVDLDGKVCLPSSWMAEQSVDAITDIHATGTHGMIAAAELIDGVSVCRRRNIALSVEALGGLSFWLLCFAPMYSGRQFASESEVVDAISILIQLLKASAIIVDELARLGAVSLRALVYETVPKQMRTSLLQGVTMALLSEIDIVDSSSAKTMVFDIFNTLILDLVYWSAASESAQIALCDMVLAMIRGASSVFRQQTGVEMFLFQIMLFQRHQGCIEAVDKLFLAAEAMVLAHINADSLTALIALIEECSTDTRWLVLRTLLHASAKNPQMFFDTIGPDLLPLFRCVEHSDERLRIFALKLLGIYVLSVRQTGARSNLAKTVSDTITTLLSPFPLTERLFQTLLQISTCQVVSELDGKLDITKEHTIELPTFLATLFCLADPGRATCASDPFAHRVLLERILMDLLSLTKPKVENLRSICHMPFWQRFLLPLAGAADKQSYHVANQLVIQLIHALLFYSISSERKGWVAYDQTLWLLPQYPLVQVRSAVASLFLEMVHSLTRGAVEQSSLLSENLRPTLQLMEHTLFEGTLFFASSACNISSQPSPQDVMLYERVLQVVLLHLPIRERRQHVLRVLLRYLHRLLPHSACASLCAPILMATSSILSDELGARTRRNLRVVRLALDFLVKAKLAFDEQGGRGDDAERVCRTIVSLISFWGAHLFDEDTPNANEIVLEDTANTVPSGHASRDEDDEFDHVQYSGGPQQALAFLEANVGIPLESQNMFIDLCQRFVTVLEKRYFKINSIMAEYLQRSDQASTRRRREFEEQHHLQSITSNEDLVPAITSTTSVPESLQCIRERNVDLLLQVKKHMKQVVDADRVQDVLCDSIKQCDDNRVFWKLDSTENAMRMRQLLRYNPHGHRHVSIPSLAFAQVPAKQELPQIEVLSSMPHDSPDQKELPEADSIAKENLLGRDEDEDVEDEFTSYEMISSEDFGEGTLHSAEVDKDLHVCERCTLISVKRKVEGMFRVSSEFIWFIGERDAPQIGVEENSQSTESPTPFRPKGFVHAIREIRQCLPRRYLLRQSGIELFLKSYRSVFITFEKKARNKVYATLCNLLKLPYELSNKRRLKYSGITEKWKNRRISNFDYLMHLNTLSGRSYNDITQYPVFPSVIADYVSEDLDLDDPSVYRDLTKPIGALNADRLALFDAKFAEMVAEANPLMPPFHYGSHYSSAGIVLYYLLRVEPFTTLNEQLQGGRFDLPDRLFHSVASSWNLSLTNLADVKELVPEFFYLPEMFVNHNDVDFGRKQNGERVSGVELPPWANSAQHFVDTQRKALESEYVSGNLHHWIDLIWGHKQRGRAAVDAHNVFFHLTYEGAVDIDAIDDDAMREATLAQIHHFGQTPGQLFDAPHPTRLSLEHLQRPRRYLRLAAASTRCLDARHVIWQPPSIAAAAAATSHAFACVRCTTANVVMHFFANTGNGLSVRRGLLFAPEATSADATTVPCSDWRNLDADAACVDMPRTGEMAVIGGFRDGSVKCILLPDNEGSGGGAPRCLSSVSCHDAPVTAVRFARVNVSTSSNALISGASDGSVALWTTFTRRASWARPPLAPAADAVFAAHAHAIADVDVSPLLGVAVSLDVAGIVAMYSTRRRCVLRRVRLPGSGAAERPSCVRLARSARVVLATNRHLFALSVNGELLATRRVPHRIGALACAGEGAYVVSGGDSPTICVWSSLDLQLLREFGTDAGNHGAHLRRVLHLDMSTRETMVCAAMDNGAVIMLQVPDIVTTTSAADETGSAPAAHANAATLAIGTGAAAAPQQQQQQQQQRRDTDPRQRHLSDASAGAAEAKAGTAAGRSHSRSGSLGSVTASVVGQGIGVAKSRVLGVIGSLGKNLFASQRSRPPSPSPPPPPPPRSRSPQ